SLRHRDAALVCVRGEHVVLAARDGDDTEATRAVLAAADRAGLRVALGVSDAYAASAGSLPARSANPTRGSTAATSANPSRQYSSATSHGSKFYATSARAGVRGPHPALPAQRRESPAQTRGADLAGAYRQAVACARLALSRGDGAVRADRLGPLRF